MLVLIAVSLVFILLILVISFKLYLSPATRWCWSHTCLVGKTALITGANTGIGYETALDFAKRGAKVILACRDSKKAEEARSKIIEETDNPKIFVKIVDMASFNSVRAFAKEINATEERLDILVNNAGITFGYDKKSEDGHDVVMQVNYYSHFLLTHLLINLLMKSGEPSRIVNISSLAAAYAKPFSFDKLEKVQPNLDTYANSKLCNILFTKELALRLQSTQVTTYSVHPGAIKTDIFRNTQGLAKIIILTVVALFYKPVRDGAQTIIFCSVEKNIEKYSGRHFDNCRVVDDYKVASSAGLPLKLWEWTERIIPLKEGEKFDFN